MGKDIIACETSKDDSDLLYKNTVNFQKETFGNKCTRYTPISEPYDKTDPSQDPYRCLNICDKTKKNWYLMGTLVLWFMVFTVFFWLLLYSLKLDYFNSSDGSVDLRKLFLVSLLIALGLSIIVWVLIVSLEL